MITLSPNIDNKKTDNIMEILQNNPINKPVAYA